MNALHDQMDQEQLLELARLCGVLRKGVFSLDADELDFPAVQELTDAYIEEVAELSALEEQEPDEAETAPDDEASDEDWTLYHQMNARGEAVRVLLGGMVARSIFAAPLQLLPRMHAEFLGLAPTGVVLTHALSYIATVSHGPAGILQASSTRALVCGPDILTREGLWEYMVWRQFPMQLATRYVRRFGFGVPTPDSGMAHYPALCTAIVDSIGSAENMWLAAENAHMGAFMARQHLSAAGMEPERLHLHIRRLAGEMLPALAQFGLDCVEGVCVLAQAVAAGAFADERQSLIQELAMLSPTVTDVSLSFQSREMEAELAESRRTEAASRARADKWRKLAQDGGEGPKPRQRKPRQKNPPPNDPPATT